MILRNPLVTNHTDFGCPEPKFTENLYQPAHTMSQPITIEDIYKLFEQTNAALERSSREFDRRIAESRAEAERAAAERAAEAERLATERAAEAERLAAQRAAETERLATERAAEAEKIAAQRAAEAEKRMAEFNQQMKELGKQIGGLGAKFGSFTEGLALPSMTKILGDRFGMEIIMPSVRIRKGKDNLEIDVLAYANGDINTAYVVEVKSHAKEESIEQLKTILNNFRYFFPEHSHKTVYGILAAVDIAENVKAKVLQEGLYCARISDDTFALDTPDDFQPKTW